jgi:D-sedoheptulose 7-phosphate isomerase
LNISVLQKEVNCLDAAKITQLNELVLAADKIIIIGNGGSNAIASHIQNDYVKVLKKKCLSFSDASMLTCYMNDYGVENAYREFLKSYCDPETLAILISSSGESENICRAAQHCSQNKIKFVMLSGFNERNKLRRNFTTDCSLDIWVDSKSYGIVECIHMIYLHSVVDV